MGWNNYKWAWNLRGVTPSEQLVCLRLADEANGRGVVDKLTPRPTAPDTRHKPP